MNASGLLWDDGALASFYVYLFWGGWVATLAGWATCLFVGIVRRRWGVAGGCALLGVLPALYILALVFLARSVGSPPSSNIAVLVVLGGMVLATLAGPISAAVMVWRTSPRPISG